MSATDRLLANALESARLGEQVPLHFPGPHAGTNVRVYDGELASLPAQRLMDMGREMIATIVAADPEAHVNLGLARRTRSTHLSNSAGAKVTLERAPLSIDIVVERVSGDDVLVIFDYFSTAVWNDDYRSAADRIAHYLRLAQRQASLNSGRMPVLFAPGGVPALVLPLTVGLNGKNVYRGISPIAQRLGEEILDDKLTLTDDPTLDGRPGSGSYDDEGVPRRRRALIERGVLRGFVYDLKTAAQAGAEPTGNGERGLFSPPSPDFSNLVLESGGTPLSEMIAGIAEGLYVQSPLGLGQGNIISGAFSNNLSLAFKIEHGEIVGRVKDASVAGNVYQDLRRVAAISREAEWVYGGMRLPYVLLPELNVVTEN
jgi:PmbA protein